MTTPIPSKAWFASGTITYTRSARTAVRQSRQTLIKLLLRHLTGDFGDISDEQAATNQLVMDNAAAIPLHDDIESRYILANGQELVIITHYAHTPALRWTDICLADQVVSGRPAIDEDDERDELEFEPDEADLNAVANGEAGPDEVEAIEADELDDDDLALDDFPTEITLERILSGIRDTTVILSSLQPGPWRSSERRINRHELAALARSIRQDGLINPLLVTRERNHYHIIAGEKRWLALCALAVAESGVANLETALDVAAQPDGGQQILAKWHYVLREVEVPARLDTSQEPQRHQRQFSQQNNVGQTRRRWSKTEDRFLQENLGRMPLAKIGEHLGRTPAAVTLRRRKLQIPAPAHRLGDAQRWHNG
ncbi:MAG: hypothetical protein Kow0031_26550 [Anaerolineae bacterium]